MKRSGVRGDGGEIVLYRGEDGTTELDVRLDQNTVWLTQKQMGELFGKDSDTIGLHVRNVFKEKELDEHSTTEESSVVQKEGTRKVTRKLRSYNLDVIISVGYRVKSQRGTQFRIWATNVLRQHLVQGYTLNERRLDAEVSRLRELQAAVDVIGRVLSQRVVTGIEAEGLLAVITDYSLALRLLDQYDHQELRLRGTTQEARFVLTVEAAREAIARMVETIGREAGSLFAREKDKGLESAIGAVYQTFDGRDLYPSVEEKAAPSLLCRQEPRLRRWQREDRRIALPLVPRRKRNPLPPGRLEAAPRQRARRSDPSHRREPAGGKADDLRRGRESHQSGEPLMPTDHGAALAKDDLCLFWGSGAVECLGQGRSARWRRPENWVTTREMAKELGNGEYKVNTVNTKDNR